MQTETVFIATPSSFVHWIVDSVTDVSDFSVNTIFLFS